MENDAEVYQQRVNNLGTLKNVNKFFGLVFFALTIIFTIDYFLTETETYEVPSSCITEGSCSFNARTPTRRGPQYVYLEFLSFNQNYRDYVQSISQTQLYSKDPSKEDVSDCGNFIDGTPCGLIAHTFPKSKNSSTLGHQF